MFREHLYKDGKSVISSIIWRLIICTPEKAGIQGGNVQGENQKNKKNLKKTKENKTQLISTTKSIFCPTNFGAGGLCVFLMLAAIIGNAPSAQAASLSENLELTRRAVAEVAPAISPVLVDTETAFLAFTPDGYITKPLVVETSITPVKTLAKPIAPAKQPAKTVVAKVKLSTSGGNHFTYGYCTYYVASRRNIPWFGNAGTWLLGAQAAGFATGSTPQVGAIIVTSEGGYTGHVGIVEAVNGDGTITISEMNYSGFARISSRTISISYSAIKGYIY